MDKSRRIKCIKLKKLRRYRNKVSRRFLALRAHKQGRKLLPKLLQEFGL